MTAPGSVLILGVGPGLGASLARRFSTAGHPIAVAARDATRLAPLIDEITAAGGVARAYAADATDEGSVTSLVAAVENDLRPLDVAIFNASGRLRASILETETEPFVEAWRNACLGGMLLGREAARRMVPRGTGSILFTGATASTKGFAGSAGFAVGKFGLRALAQCMARELGPQGIHVAHFVIDGGIDNPRTRERIAGTAPERMADDGLLSPDAIAESYYHTHCQPRSAWSHEIDLRPWRERF